MDWFYELKIQAALISAIVSIGIFLVKDIYLEKKKMEKKIKNFIAFELEKNYFIVENIISCFTYVFKLEKGVNKTLLEIKDYGNNNLSMIANNFSVPFNHVVIEQYKSVLTDLALLNNEDVKKIQNVYSVLDRIELNRNLVETYVNKEERIIFLPESIKYLIDEKETILYMIDCLYKDFTNIPIENKRHQFLDYIYEAKEKKSKEEHC